MRSSEGPPVGCYNAGPHGEPLPFDSDAAASGATSCLVAAAGFDQRPGAGPGPGRAWPSRPDPGGLSGQPERPRAGKRSSDIRGQYLRGRYLRGRSAGAAFPGLGNPALRPVQSASRHHQPADRDPVPATGLPTRHPGRAGRDPDAAAATGRLRRRPDLRLAGRRSPGSEPGAAPTGRCRLSPGATGRRPR